MLYSCKYMWMKIIDCSLSPTLLSYCCYVIQAFYFGKCKHMFTLITMADLLPEILSTFCNNTDPLFKRKVVSSPCMLNILVG